MKDNKTYSEEWKEYLITQLKACAKVLDDNAEEIIGKYMFTGDLDIMITIDTNGSESKHPRINISKDYFPDYKIIAGAYNNFKNKRRKQNFQELVIKENLSGDIEKYNNIK